MAGLQIDTEIAERVLTPRGELCPHTADTLHTTVYAYLVGWSDVLVDLRSLTVVHPRLLHVFPTALADAGGWPAARLVLFGAPARTARQLRTEGIVAAVLTATHRMGARGMLAVRPERLSRRTDLTPDLDVRAVVTSASEAWGVAGRFPDAVLVATELVSNAVRHGATPAVLILALDRHGMHVAVRDAAPGGARAIRTGRGRGLNLVAELARAWGVSAHADGKTVWAVLTSR